MLLEEERSLVQRDSLRPVGGSREEPRPLLVSRALGLEADDLAVEVRGALNVVDDQHELGEAGRKTARAHRTTTSATASSIACSVVSSSEIPEAPAFSSTCSGRDAPTIADATFSSRSTQASASCAIVTPRLSAIGTSRFTLSRTSSSR